jgi:hypothetical protein
MRWHLAGVLAVAAFSCSGPASAGDASAVHKPRLNLRATPRVAFLPVEVFLVGELKGGQDVEEFYCPGLVWDWGDGSRSAHESDCSPYQDGTQLERFFSARHAFHAPGMYSVRLFLIRAGRTLTVASVPVRVYGQFGSGPESDF